MFILVTGQGNTYEYAERVRNYLSYRGTACLSYNFEEPVEAMHDGAMISLQQYADVIDLPIKDIYGGPKDLDLMTSSRAWLEDKLPLCKLAHARINTLTARWVELDMHYVVIVYGNMTKKDLEAFPGSYKVLLSFGEQESRDNSASLNDCAVCNIFDQVVDTIKTTPDEAANLIGASYNDKIRSLLRRT